MEHIVEQLKEQLALNRRMLDMCAVALGIKFDEKVLAQAKQFSQEAEACNEALRAILGDTWMLEEDDE